MKVLILDLDGTLWDHEDASRLVPPFRVGGDVVKDRYGEELRLFPGVRDFLEWASERFILSIASWNMEEPVKPILDVTGIWEYFRYPKIEGHPNKADMIKRTLEQLKKEGHHISEVIYVDDRDIHLGNIRRDMPEVKFIQMWVDVKSFEELKRKLEEL